MESLAIDSPQYWRFVLVHGLLSIFAAGAVLALFLRSRRPARARDVVYWLALIPAGILIGSKLGMDAHVAPFAYGLAGFISIVGLTGTALTLLRWSRGEPEPRTGLAIAMLVGFSLLTTMMMPVTPARVAARRVQCKNNLKNIGLALHNFSEQHNGLPNPAIETDPPRSWRVDVLPYLDQHALRASYHDDSTWESQVNLEPGRHGQIYVCPSMANPFDDQKRTLTCYAAVTGPASVFSPENRSVFPRVPDGSSTTIMVIEACGRRIAWTDPRDVDVSDSPIKINSVGKQPGESPAIGSSPHIGGCHVLMANGSVRFITENIDESLLKKLLTASGGDAVGDEDF